MAVRLALTVAHRRTHLGRILLTAIWAEPMMRYPV